MEVEEATVSMVLNRSCSIPLTLGKKNERIRLLRPLAMKRQRRQLDLFVGSLVYVVILGNILR